MSFCSHHPFNPTPLSLYLEDSLLWVLPLSVPDTHTYTLENTQKQGFSCFIVNRAEEAQAKKATETFTLISTVLHQTSKEVKQIYR